MAQDNTISLADPYDRSSLPDLVATIRQLADLASRGQTEDPSAGADGNGLVSHALAVAQAAEQRLAEQFARIARLERIAHTDELTGLLNRRGFMGELQRSLDAARRYGECGLLVFVDLDSFKPINDTYGHAAGDEVLRQIARLLHENVRSTDYVGRLGGDEFGVLLTRTGRADGRRRVRALETLINGSVVAWNGRLIAPRASFGAESYGPNDDAGDLMHRADSAMYQTKRLRADTAEQRAIA